MIRHTQLWVGAVAAVALGVGVARAADESAPPPLQMSTGPFAVPPGDTVACVYTGTISDRDLNVVKMRARQGPGGHHFSVYYTDTPRPPETRPCTDDDMVGRHFVMGIGGHDPGVEERTEQMLPGLAARIPKGKQVLLESHHINPTGSVWTTQDTVELSFISSAQVKAYVQLFLIEETHFTVPAHAQYRRVMGCTVPRALTVTMVMAHLHEFGTRYMLEMVSPSGAPLRTLFDVPWAPANKWSPPVQPYFDPPLAIAQGTRLRQTCQWHNPTDQPISFPSEMCVGVLNYLSDGKEEVACTEVEHQETVIPDEPPPR